MASSSEMAFFDRKRPWSEYKDRVLDYYLVPYLQKVKELGKPIVVFDMFAGRGRFKSGELGSPLIIANRLRPLHETGTRVKLVCIEERPEYARVLTEELAPYPFATAECANSLDKIEQIEREAATSTVLLYVDPCDVAQLHLAKLALAYERVRQSSVEVLLVFMARAFLRQAFQILKLESKLLNDVFWDKLVQESEGEDRDMWIHALYGGSEVKKYDYVQRARVELTDVAGGAYWQDVASDRATDFRQKLLDLVARYKAQMRRWFRVCLSLPIYDVEGERTPKYWLIFGSRYPPACDLINDAACKVRRAQGIAYSTAENSLFRGVQIDTSADPGTVVTVVRQELKEAKQIRWEELRWKLADRDLGQFTQKEMNGAIKELVRRGEASGPTSAKIEDAAMLRWHRS